MGITTLYLAIATTLLYACGTSAFPALMEEVARQVQERSINGFVEVPSLNKRIAFDPQAQLVSTTGEHAFVAPTSSDLRGPCPGLNAMANQYVKHPNASRIK